MALFDRFGLAISMNTFGFAQGLAFPMPTGRLKTSFFFYSSDSFSVFLGDFFFSFCGGLCRRWQLSVRSAIVFFLGLPPLALKGSGSGWRAVSAHLLLSSLRLDEFRGILPTFTPSFFFAGDGSVPSSSTGSVP